MPRSDWSRSPKPAIGVHVEHKEIGRRGPAVPRRGQRDKGHAQQDDAEKSLERLHRLFSAPDGTEAGGGGGAFQALFVPACLASGGPGTLLLDDVKNASHLATVDIAGCMAPPPCVG